MKRILSIMLALAVVFTMSVVALPQEQAYADTEGYFTYYSDFYDKTQCRIASYNGDEVNLVIPDTINGMKVTSIGGFSNKKYVKTIKFPKYLKTIEDGCFKNCTNLESVTIPATVEAANGFSGCTKLKTVIIKEGVKTIGACAFKGCTALTSVTIPSTVTEIRYNAFEETTALRSITLPAGLKSMEHDAFKKSGITSIDIPDNVSLIGADCFYKCTNLKTAVIGKKVQEFGYPADCTFEGCTALETVDFSKNTRIRKLTRSSFKDCTSLKSITMPRNLEVIEYENFTGCTSLTSITFNEGLKEIQSRILADTQVTSVRLPKTIQKVHVDAFKDSNVTKIQFDGTIADSYNGNMNGFFSYPQYTVSMYDNSEFLDIYKNAYDKKTTVTTRKSIPSTGLKLSKSNVNVVEGTPVKITATLTPSDTTDGVIWESSNDRICHVSQTGILSYESEGSAVVTARTVSGQIKQIAVVCQKLPTTLKVVNSSGTSVSKTSITKGKTKRLTAIVDNGRTDVKIKWSSSDTTIAKVSSTGKITTYKRGTCKIYCKTEVGGLKKTITVTVK